EDGIRDRTVTGVQTCALPISHHVEDHRFVLFLVSGEAVIFNVMGGMGTLVGPVAGAAFFLVLREAFSRFFPEYYLIPVGVIFTRSEERRVGKECSSRWDRYVC